MMWTVYKKKGIAKKISLSRINTIMIDKASVSLDNWYSNIKIHGVSAKIGYMLKNSVI